MILDRLEESHLYSRLHPGFEMAFDLLRSTPFDEIKPGRHEVMGNDVVLIFEQIQGKGRAGAKLEAHKKYIDVQYVIPRAGAIAEDFGWHPTGACTKAGAYDEAKDVTFYEDQPKLWLTVQPGQFVVFYPSDAHAPLACDGEIHKAVVKIAVNW